MVESIAEVLVKEERQPEEILAVIPPPIFLWWWLAASLFICFLSLPPSVVRKNTRRYT
jgi:hypothetical protein